MGNNEKTQSEKQQIGPKVSKSLVRDIKVYCYQKGIDFQDFVEEALRARYENVIRDK